MAPTQGPSLLHLTCPGTRGTEGRAQQGGPAALASRLPQAKPCFPTVGILTPQPSPPPSLLPVHSIHVDHSEHLAEGNDEEGDGASIAVQQGQPVLAGVQREDEGDEVHPQADEACGAEGRAAATEPPYQPRATGGPGPYL